MFNIKDPEKQVWFVVGLMLLIATILLVITMMIAPADAQQVNENADYKKSFDKNQGKFGKIILEEKTGQKEKTTTIELISNTEQCVECSAILKIDVNKNKQDLLTAINLRKAPKGTELTKKIKIEDKMFWSKKNVNDYGLKYQILENITKTDERETNFTYTLAEWNTVTLNQLNNKLNKKGIYYIKIIANKDANEILDWTPTFFGDLESFEWAIWGTTYIYDEINDSSINNSLWTTYTQCTGCSGGGGFAVINESNDYIYGVADAYHTSGSSTARVTLNSTNLPTLNRINNITLQAYYRALQGVGDPSGTNSISLFFSDVGFAGASCSFTGSCSISDTSVWTIIKNKTVNNNTFDVFNDGAFAIQINATNNILKFVADAYHPSTGISSLADFRLYYVYYTLDGNLTIVTQNNPASSSSVSSLPISFNCTSTPYDILANITSIDLYIDNSLIYKANYTGTGTKSFEYSTNSSQGNHTWYCTSNDTFFGEVNSTLRNYQVSEFVAEGNNYTQLIDKPNINEGDVAEFILEVYVANLSTTTANLWHNGIMYSPDSYEINGNLVTFVKNLTIPDGSGNMTGSSVTWSWNITIEDSISNFFTENETQTIYSIEFDDCSVYTEQILNLTFYDEGNDTIIDMSLNPIIEVDLVLLGLNGNNSWSYSNTYNSNNGSICVPSYVLNNTNYLMNVIVGYQSDEHVKEFWYLDNGFLQENNDSLDAYTTKNVILRGLLVADSTTFLFKFYDENYLLQPNSIVTVLRRYIGEGVFKEAERSKQDDNGETHVHLVEEDVIYKFRITLDGDLLYESSEYNAKCVQTPCSITLTQPSSSEDIDNEFDNLAEGTYHISSNETDRTVTLTFNLQDTGTMTLEVYQYQVDGNTTNVLVGSNSATAKTGTVEVTIPPSYANTTYYAVVRHNDQWIRSQWIDFSKSGFEYFGTLGVFLAGILIMTLGLIAISHGGWSILFMLMGLFLAIVTKMLDLDWYTYMFIACAGFLIIWKLTERRSF